MVDRSGGKDGAKVERLALLVWGKVDCLQKRERKLTVASKSSTTMNGSSRVEDQVVVEGNDKVKDCS